MGLSSGGPPLATGSIGAAASQSPIVDVHSNNCAGLALERETRLKRIGDLEKAAENELKETPATIAQALARMGNAPLEGTRAHSSIQEERALLASNAAAAAKINCPSQAASTPEAVSSAARPRS